METTNETKLLIAGPEIEEMIETISRELVELNEGVESLVLLGIHRRGINISERIAKEIYELTKQEVPRGTLDITLYRDDLLAIGPRPIVGETRLPRAGIDGRTVAIIDDVVYTGRIVRAALEEITYFGRSDRIYLCSRGDRGGRELPIRPDIAGRGVEVSPGYCTAVRVPETDGRLAVDLVPAPEG